MNESSDSQHRILVVDDEPNIVDVVSHGPALPGLRGRVGRDRRATRSPPVAAFKPAPDRARRDAARHGGLRRRPAPRRPARAACRSSSSPRATRPRTRSAASRSAATTTSPSRSASRSSSRGSARSCAAPASPSPSRAGSSFEDLELDEDAHEVTRGGEHVELTATEYRLLRYLMLNPRRVLTRAQLLEHVWDYDFGGDARVLETYVSYLRKKLDVHGPPLIHTVRGVGYALRQPPTSVMALAARPAARRRCSRSRAVGLLLLGAHHLRRAALVPARPRRPAGARRAARGRRARSPTRGHRPGRRRDRDGDRGGGPPAAAARHRPAARHLRRAARRRRQGARRAIVFGYGQNVTADARRSRRTSPVGKLITVDGEDGDGTRYRVLAARDPFDGGTTVVAVPLQRRRPDAAPPARSSRALVIAGVLLALGAAALGRRARRPAAARPHGPHRRRDRRRRPLAPRRADRPAHRGRPPRHRAQRDARPARAGVRRAPGERGPAAPVPRRRLARAAHAAGVDPRLRRAVPHGRRARARGRREGDAAHRGRGGAHGRARRGPADARAPRRGRRRAARRASTSAALVARRRRRRARDRARPRRSTRRVDGAGARRSATPTSCARCSPTCCATRSSTRRPGTPIEVSVGARGRRRRASRCATTAPACRPTTPSALFERFWRAEGGRERGRAGAGLGLAIVAGIVDAHGGTRRRPTNAPDGGASFVVRLPAA